VYAECINANNDKIVNADNIAIVIRFADGSVGNLSYLANGDKSLPKELIEVFSGGKVGIIHDFREAVIHKGGKAIKIKSEGKGHKEEVQAFVNALRNGGPSPIPFRSVYLTTLTSFRILDSLYTGNPQIISSYESEI
jgi:polar amino acid transport system substrate-binding protein